MYWLKVFNSQGTCKTRDIVEKIDPLFDSVVHNLLCTDCRMRLTIRYRKSTVH